MSTCRRPQCSQAGTMPCHRCNEARYCSKPCQKQDWARHKLACEPGATRDEREASDHVGACDTCGQFGARAKCPQCDAPLHCGCPSGGSSCGALGRASRIGVGALTLIVAALSVTDPRMDVEVKALRIRWIVVLFTAFAAGRWMISVLRCHGDCAERHLAQHSAVSKQNEATIDSYEAELQRCEREGKARSLEWANAHNSLGLAYSVRTMGDRRKNLDHAAKHYAQALEALPPQEHAERHAKTRSLLAVVLLGLEDVEQAIGHFLAVLDLVDEERQGAMWANTNHELGDAYLRRSGGVRRDNVEFAIRHLTRAAGKRSGGSPKADSEHLLGAAHMARVTGDPQANATRALELLTSALRLRSSKTQPHKWAQTHCELGWAQLRLGDPHSALEHFCRALSMWRARFHRAEWARAAVGRAAAELRLGADVDRAELEEAVVVAEGSSDARDAMVAGEGRLALAEVCARGKEVRLAARNARRAAKACGRDSWPDTHARAEALLESTQS